MRQRGEVTTGLVTREKICRTVWTGAFSKLPGSPCMTPHNTEFFDCPKSFFLTKPDTVPEKNKDGGEQKTEGAERQKGQKDRRGRKTEGTERQERQKEETERKCKKTEETESGDRKRGMKTEETEETERQK